MKEIIITSIENFHRKLNSYRKAGSCKFRGHSNINWKLVPKAGRSPYDKVDDRKLFHHWKRRAISQLKREQNTDWELLAIAQHTGLPTRLLDWTHNPLTAAFFATAENFNFDGAIYVYRPESFVITSLCTPYDVPDDGKIQFYQPNAASERIANQYGYFSLHNTPTKELSDQSRSGTLEKLIIPVALKRELMFMLNQYGINYLTLFPDLEGLSKHLCWFAENYSFWDGTIDDQLENA